MSERPLCVLPTPIHRLRRLSERVGADLWIKRDDLTGFGVSGNKIRKLQLLLRDAVQTGADTIITCGGIQSNHCRATAVACRTLGLQPVLLLRGEPQSVATGNLLLDQILGAEIHFCTAEVYRNHRTETMDQLASRLRSQGRRPYVIPEGGSNGLGALAFQQAAQECAQQLDGKVDATIVAVGSGGTLAGLAMGEGIGFVHGFAVCDDRNHFVGKVVEIAQDAARHGGRPLPAVGENWDVCDTYRGPGYGIATREVWAVIETVAREEGIFLDPVYTGKAMHGLLSEIRNGQLGGRIVFWHTGGAFGLFGRGDEWLANP